MKIVTYKVPCTLIRKDGGVQVVLDEPSKVRLSETLLADSEKNNIPNIAKGLSDQNSIQLELLKNTLLNKESQGTGTVEFKYLEE